MQKNEVKAFRQRLIRAGFFDVCIYERFDGSYNVICFRYEKNTLVKYNVIMTIVQMINSPRLVWFD